MNKSIATKLLASLHECGEEAAGLTTDPSDHEALHRAGVLEAADYSGQIRARLDTISEWVDRYHSDDQESDFDQLEQLVEGYRELTYLLAAAKTSV